MLKCSLMYPLVTKTIDYTSSPLHRYFLSILATRQAITTQTSCIHSSALSIVRISSKHACALHAPNVATWQASRAARCMKVNALRLYNKKKMKHYCTARYIWNVALMSGNRFFTVVLPESSRGNESRHDAQKLNATATAKSSKFNTKKPQHTMYEN